MKPIDLSLVLTLYNEGTILKENLEKVFQLLCRAGLDFEIIFVDDKSEDDSLKIAQGWATGKENCHFIVHLQNVGRGGSVRQGLNQAKGEVIGFIDTDLEVSPEKIPDAVRLIQTGQADVVTGRRCYKIYISTLFRHLLTRGYHALVAVFLKLPIRDTETGFKFFRRDKILSILAKTKDDKWFWDTEVMAKSYRAGLRIKEVPVIFRRRPDKKSTVRIFADSFDYFKKLAHFRKEYNKQIDETKL